ncbi:MAG: cutinase family protein [Candidatus Saccharimonadales bacterium]
MFYCADAFVAPYLYVFWGHEKIIIFAIVASLVLPMYIMPASSFVACVDVQFIFARGSGAAQGKNEEYLMLENSIKHEASTSSFTYEISDINYPAIRTDDIGVALGAYISAGKVGALANSISSGIKNLTRYYQEISATCPATYWVLFGYSQGAQVVAGALQNLNADNIIYVALFGDPHLYLPEGEGIFPPACDNNNLSSYRTYAPNCHTDSGILGARKPYLSSDFSDKVGLWCNDADFVCGNSKNIFINSGHLDYTNSNGIPSAVKIAMRKIKDALPAQVVIVDSAPIVADIAFVVDASTSMQEQILKFKPEAIRLAASVIRDGGHVALLTYRDIAKEGIRNANILCDFDCSLGEFTLLFNGNGLRSDSSTSESLIVAASTAIDALAWRQDGAKAIIALTNVGYEKPNSLIATQESLIQKSQQNSIKIYVVATSQTHKTQYEILTGETGGKSYTINDADALSSDLLQPSPLTPRPASQRRLAAKTTPPQTAPTNLHITIQADGSARISWQNPPNISSNLLIIDDAILGTISASISEVTIKDLDPSKPHKITLRSLSADGQLYDALTDTIPAKLVQVSAPQDSRIIGVPNTGSEKTSHKK